MSAANNLRKQDVAWGYLANFLNVAAGLILLPLIVHYLPAEDVALWIVFVTLANLARLTELGLRPTLIRNTSYIYSGATTLKAEGIDVIEQAKQVDYALLADLLAAARFLYFRVGLGAAVALLGAGSIFILSIATDTQPLAYVMPAWVAFASGYVITLYFAYYSGLLQGRGDITDANKAIVVSRGTLILLGSVSLACGWGLFGLGLASMVSALVDRLLTYRYFFSTSRPETDYLRNQKGVPSVLAGTLWHNSIRLGLVHIAGFLTLQANILVATSLLGLRAAASFSLTMQMLTTLLMLSGVLFQLQTPQMNALQIQGRTEALRYAYGAAVLAALGSFCLGAVALIVFGNDLLRLVHSDTLLLERALLVTFALLMLFEAQLLLSGAYLATLNEIPFLRAALVSGALVVTAGSSLAYFSDFGLWSFAIAQASVQGSYNYWKWPRVALSHLGCTFFDQFKYGMTRLGDMLRM